MSERNEGQPALPDMELINIIESMTVENRIEEKRRLLSEVSDRESLINLIDQVNEAEGADVTIIY
jgi:hypothetical protein